MLYSYVNCIKCLLFQDNVMPGGGNGDFRGRQFFTCRIGHALFLPVTDLLKVDSDNPANCKQSFIFSFAVKAFCYSFEK